MTMVKISGVKQVIENLAKRRKKINQAVDNGVLATAGQVQREAIVSISARPSQGITYRRGNKTHMASAPGDAPNTDTGNLVRHIAISHVKGSKVAYVYDDTEDGYGAILELLKDRPWLRPALEAKKDRLEPNIRQQIAKVNK